MHRVYNLFLRNLGRCKLQSHDADKVAIALSGGPDSMALAALTARWHQQDHVTSVSLKIPSLLEHLFHFYTPYTYLLLTQSQEPPLALVVDHQLRPESTDEAHEAAQCAADMGLRAEVLTVDWEGSVPKRGQKMRAAREARYSILLGACKEAGVGHLMTAHHADDQIETFLLRLIHASGLDGLAGIAPINRTYIHSHGVRLLRPLLGVHKFELASVCSELHLSFAVDPTNDDPSYQRNRIRQLLKETAAAERAEWEMNHYNNNIADSSSTQEFYHHHHDYQSSNGFLPQNFVPQIAKDVLTLQRLCAKVSHAQQHQATSLLKRSLLHSAPCTRLIPRPTAQRATIHPGYEPYTPRRRWVHWPSQLAALSHKTRDVPHAILQAGPFNGAEETVAAAAVSHLLQAVSGSGYPPSLSDSTKLAKRLAGGKLVGAFTGGGCTVQPIVHSKGRYVLIVPQKNQGTVLGLLREPREQHSGDVNEVKGDVVGGCDDLHHSDGESMIQEASG